MNRFPLEWFTGKGYHGEGINVIPYGSGEPDREGRYIDRAGLIWECNDEGEWSTSFKLFGRLTHEDVPWVDMDPDDFPWTELYA